MGDVLAGWFMNLLRGLGLAAHCVALGPRRSETQESGECPISPAYVFKRCAFYPID